MSERRPCTYFAHALSRPRIRLSERASNSTKRSALDHNDAGSKYSPRFWKLQRSACWWAGVMGEGRKSFRQ